MPRNLIAFYLMCLAFVPVLLAASVRGTPLSCAAGDVQNGRLTDPFVRLEAKEINFRCNRSVGRLPGGSDVWWYDCNWRAALAPPAPNLCKEAQGMWLYPDTTVRVRPDQRSLIMASVDGIGH
jgi:hypothetical protein